MRRYYQTLFLILILVSLAGVANADLSEKLNSLIQKAGDNIKKVIPGSKKKEEPLTTKEKLEKQAQDLKKEAAAATEKVKKDAAAASEQVKQDAAAASEKLKQGINEAADAVKEKIKEAEL